MSELSQFRVPGLSAGEVEGLEWRETSVEGVSWILMAADEVASREEKRGGACVLIRMCPGRGYPAHRHLGAEDVLVLQGGYRDEFGDHVAGDFVRYPPGSDHAPVALGEVEGPVGPENPACVLFSSIAEGIELL